MIWGNRYMYMYSWITAVSLKITHCKLAIFQYKMKKKKEKKNNSQKHGNREDFSQLVKDLLKKKKLHLSLQSMVKIKFFPQISGKQ